MQSTYDKIQYYKLDSQQKETLSSKLKALLQRRRKSRPLGFSEASPKAAQ
jgi:hypothetical protein